MEWGNANKDIAPCVFPILAPLSFGKAIYSIYFDEAFIEEINTISMEHDLGAKLVSCQNRFS
jgi:hypothetical protein